MTYCKLLFLLILPPCFGYSQKVINPYFGPVFYAANGGNGVGGTIGIGFKERNVGIGAGLEFVGINKLLVVPVHAELRFYFSPKNVSPYITLQPGYNFRSGNSENNNSNVQIKNHGGIYAGVGVGLYAFPKRPGFNFQIKYVLMSNTSTSSVRYLNGYSYNTSTNRLVTRDNFISIGLHLVI